MKRFLIVLAVLAVAGCAATSKPLKHGKRGLHVNCSGLTSSWEKCYAKAANSCGEKGYKILAKSGDAVEDPSRSMIIICK